MFVTDKALLDRQNIHFPRIFHHCIPYGINNARSCFIRLPYEKNNGSTISNEGGLSSPSSSLHPFSSSFSSFSSYPFHPWLKFLGEASGVLHIYNVEVGGTSPLLLRWIHPGLRVRASQVYFYQLFTGSNCIPSHMDMPAQYISTHAATLGNRYFITR